MLDAKNSSADVTVDDVNTRLVEMADDVRIAFGGTTHRPEEGLLSSDTGSCSLQHSSAHAHCVNRWLRADANVDDIRANYYVTHAHRSLGFKSPHIRA